MYWIHKKIILLNFSETSLITTLHVKDVNLKVYKFKINKDFIAVNVEWQFDVFVNATYSFLLNE